MEEEESRADQGADGGLDCGTPGVPRASAGEIARASGCESRRKIATGVPLWSAGALLPGQILLSAVPSGQIKARAARGLVCHLYGFIHCSSRHAKNLLPRVRFQVGETNQP